MTTTSKITLAALDMAGTTVAEGGAVYLALDEAVSAAAGRPVPPDVLRRWHGADKREAITGLLTALDGSALGEPERLDPERIDPERIDAVFADFSRRLDDAYGATPPEPIDGVEEAFATLRAQGVRVVLTTGFSDRVATAMIAGLGWVIGETIDGLVTAEQVGAGRPSPRMIHEAMTRTGVADAGEVVAAGDTLLDLQAGANAGAAMVVGVLTGAEDEATLSTGPATHLLKSVADLPALLASR